MGTDKDWKKWGATDPYFGVLSSENFRKENINNKSREEFFLTGEDHVARILNLISENFDEKLVLSSVLDFGCGVGRLAIPFARRAGKCVGVDVSPAMLSEAAINSTEAGIQNIEYINSSNGFSEIKDQFSLVHTYLVLQHIPWSRGRKIIQQLAGKVENGGFLAIHFFLSSDAPKIVRALVRIRYAIPPVNWIRNILRRRPMFEPAMQLHIYNEKTISSDLKNLGFDAMVSCVEPDMDGFKSIFLLTRRKMPDNRINRG
jgi:SAM-dependent methyltransferase